MNFTTAYPLHIYSSIALIELPVNQLHYITDSVFNREHIKNDRIFNLICCNDYKIRKLNREYRDIDKVTDVLSFPFEDNDFLGEIYISVRRTAVQARRFGVTVPEEFMRLFTHGLLHLIGYDHCQEQERLKMEKRERFYLNQISFS